MINKAITNFKQSLRVLNKFKHKQHLQISNPLCKKIENTQNEPQSSVEKYTLIKYLHLNKLLQNSHRSQQLLSSKILKVHLSTSKNLKPHSLHHYFSSTAKHQPNLNYNSFQTIRQLHNISQTVNKINPSLEKIKFLSSHYPVITLELQKKLQKIELILNSQEVNLYKIVQQTIIALEAFAATMRRDVMEENLLKVVKEFGAKIISTYLENVQNKQNEIQINQKNQSQQGNFLEATLEVTDSSYLIHQNYNAPQIEVEDKYYPEPSANITIDTNFILHYIETLKSWLLTRIETDSLISSAQQQMLEFLNARQVSDLQETLKFTMDLIINNYIQQPSVQKRQIFPFDLKIRGLILLPYFENKHHVEKYLQRLADENLFIYLRESQMITLLYDVAKLQPDLTNLSHFVYQVQSSRVYMNLTTINTAYIKALFINYTRKFMVSYHEIQFYEIFRDIQPRIRYPTIRTFIRLIQILKTQAADLHCDYNKVMNKYNYNIIISIIISHQYSVENTKLDEFLQLFETLNSLEKSGEILYDEMSKFLKSYLGKEKEKFKTEQLANIYKIFLHVIDQAKPLYKYQEKQGLNKEFTKKTASLLNILIQILLQKYPQVIFIAHKFIRNYILSDDGANSSFLIAFQLDDRDIHIQTGNSFIVENRLQKLKNAFEKAIDTKMFLYRSSDSDVRVQDMLDSISLFMRINLHVSQGETNQSTQQKEPQNKKLLYHLYPLTPKVHMDESILANTLNPLIQEFVSMVKNNKISSMTGTQLVQIYKNLYKLMDAIGSLKLGSIKNTNQQISQKLITQIQFISNYLLTELKSRVDKKTQQQERQRANNTHSFQISVPQASVELLLCIERSSQLLDILSGKKQRQCSSILRVNLASIYQFLNKIAIQNLKSIQEEEVIPMLKVLELLEEIKSNDERVLLLQIDRLVYEYLYMAMSMFVMYLGNSGKYFLKLSSSNADSMMNIIVQFVNNKAKFKQFSSKKRLVVLQLILVGLVRRKSLKIGMTHLKRSEHARIFLSVLQIFEYPQNLTVDLKKILEDVQFLPSDLEEYPKQMLESYSEINYSILKYLQDNKLSIVSPKKLSKLTEAQLWKEFEGRSSNKIYEMILKNSKYQLPFQLPEPVEKNAKIIYILEKIYQKIARTNNYSVARTIRSDIKNKKGKLSFQQTLGEIFQKKFPVEQYQIKQENLLKEQQENGKVDEDPALNSGFSYVDLGQQLAYIRRKQLVKYSQEDHYKMTQNKLPIHYKKETWKNLFALTKELQIESLQIDQKVDESIYKLVLLALLDYVEKVKIVTKEFHSHSFIQYVAAQLDIDVNFRGSIARISRKNKPTQDIIVVSALQSNYKLMYICTHILRQSGQNAYILSDRTKESDFREFLVKMLPQSFQPEESQIVQKAVKGQIELDVEDV